MIFPICYLGRIYMCVSSENNSIFCNLYSGIPQSSKS